MKTLFTLFLMLCLCSGASAQLSDFSFAQAAKQPTKKKEVPFDKKAYQKLLAEPTEWYAGLSFSNFVPQGEFMDSLGRSSQGFSIYGGYTNSEAHLGCGLQVDFMFTGRDEDIYEMYTTDPFGRRIYYYDTVSMQNMMIPITLYGRFNQQFFNFLEPYFEVFGGMNIYSSSMSYNSGLVLQGKQVTDSDTKLNVSFTYGIGGGAMFKLLEYAELPSTHFKMLLDLRARYYYGGKATYRRGYLLDGGYNFKETTSKTAMVMIHAGLTFQF